mgnify:CR=1 FL=1
MSRPDTPSRPWLVIQNDAGEWLAPRGVWTKDANRRYNFAEFSGRPLAERLATLHGGAVAKINPPTWAEMPKKEPTA